MSSDRFRLWSFYICAYISFSINTILYSLDIFKLKHFNPPPTHTHSDHLYHSSHACRGIKFYNYCRFPILSHHTQIFWHKITLQKRSLFFLQNEGPWFVKHVIIKYIESRLNVFINKFHFVFLRRRTSNILRR